MRIIVLAYLACGTAALWAQTPATSPAVQLPGVDAVVAELHKKIGLAVRMYYDDKGAYPPNLQALVPAYLPVVPQDPFSPVGDAIQYRLALEGHRPVIGSVGPDGADAQLLDEELSEKPSYGAYGTPPGEPDDIWIDLSPWKPGP